MATRKEVAQRAGVSVATVSYVINGTKKVTDEVEKRVLQAVRELNYRPNLLARGLTTKTTRHVAILVDNLYNPHYSDILSGAQAVASENGYIVSIISVDLARPEDILDLTSRGVEGVIPAMMRGNRRILELMPDMPTSEAGEYIHIEYDSAMNAMVSHLQQMGHRRIAFLYGMELKDSGAEHERMTAWKKAMENHGLEVIPELIVGGRPGARMDNMEGEHAMSELLDRDAPFTAVYAMNDLMALGAMRVLRQRGLRAPEDVSIVGCDRLPVYRSVSPTLASMDLHAFETGRCLMQQMIETIAHRPHGHTRITVEYVPGESVGPVHRL